jgi:hypothetical protein
MAFFNQSAHFLFAQRSADATAIQSSTTLADDTVLKLAVKKNATYRLKALILSNSGATPDLKVTFTGPTGATGKWLMSPAGATVGGTPNALAAAVALDGAGADIAHIIDGYVTTSVTEGLVTFQWAQNTSDASNTKILAGSWLKLERVA